MIRWRQPCPDRARRGARGGAAGVAMPSMKFTSGPFEVVGNGKRLLVESDYAPPGPVARFQALDSFGQLAEIHRKTIQNNWWYAAACISSFFGFAAGVYYVEISNLEHQQPEILLPAFGTGFVRFCIVVLAFLTICALAVYYDGYVYILQIKGLYVPKNASFFMRLRRAGLLDTCFWDMLVQLILPWPLFGLDVAEVYVFNGSMHAYSRYAIGDLLVLGMLLRLRLLPRFLALFHPLNSADAQFYGKLNSLEVNASMITRVLVGSSLWFLMATWSLAVFIFSYIIYVFERDAHDELPPHAMSHFSSCVRLAFTTMTTIGYGDAYPFTRLGRAAAVVSCFVAVALFAVTINFVMKMLALESNEETLVRVVRKADARRAVKRTAVHVIESVYRRSPMFERFRLQKERYRKEQNSYNTSHQYQEIAEVEQRNIEVFGGQIEMDAKPSEIYYGSGRFNREQLLNLREALDDRKTMEKLKAFREARQQLVFLTKSQEADRNWQLGELSSTHVRLQGQMKTLSTQARQLSAMLKEKKQPVTPSPPPEKKPALALA